MVIFWTRSFLHRQSSNCEAHFTLLVIGSNKSIFTSEHGVSIAALSLSRHYHHGMRYTKSGTMLYIRRSPFSLDFTNWPLSFDSVRVGETRSSYGGRANTEHAFLKSLFSHAHLMPSRPRAFESIALGGRRGRERERVRRRGKKCPFSCEQKSRALPTFCFLRRWLLLKTDLRFRSGECIH